MKSKKGFTLIELLVVIAIIGILAAIVLVSLRGAPARAKNAKIKADVAQVRGIAEMIYSDNAHGDYTDLCDTTDNTLKALTDYPQLTTLETDMTDQGATVTCHSSAQEYCVSASLLVGEGDFCVDSTGMAKTHSAGASCDGTNFDCVAP
jgi:prepilin-type N-terminal cleavage/methylation domain-containing protein